MLDVRLCVSHTAPCSLLPAYISVFSFLLSAFPQQRLRRHALRLAGQSQRGGPPYTTWATAAHVIQDAVDAAVAGDTVLVAGGVYATGGRAVGTNLLVNRVAIDRAITVESLMGPEVTIIQGYQVPGTTNGDGAVRCVYLTNGASLSGFTLTNGATRAVESGWPTHPESSGGGLWCESTNGVVSNCVLAGNSAYHDGGGAYLGTLNHCTLTGNSAGDSGGGASGGTLNNCALTGNSAAWDGGGASGGTLNNCTLTGNSAKTGGGVAGVFFGPSSTLNNCTLTGNSAAWDGGGASASALNNCIVYFNAAQESPNYGYSTLNYCCTTPLPADGTGNISLDPQLLDAAHLSPSSPCRGAGNAAYTTGTDIDGEVWVTPPSIGCDEYHPGPATGPLRVTLAATFTNVLAGYSVGLTALIEGRASLSVWDFGDGLALTNRPYTTHAWTTLGNYAVVLRAYNESNPGGVSATATVHVVAQPVHYVAADNVTPVPPYTSWATAATNIQDAIDAVDVTSLPPSSVLVLVTNGVYATGGRALVGTMTNRVVVDKPLIVRSVNGPEFTVIQGRQVPGTTNGDGAIRCVYLTEGASLSGFTLTKGATRASASGISDSECSGGGVFCDAPDALSHVGPYALSTVVSNCVLTGNSADRLGGGTCGGTVSHSTLATNSAGGGGGAFESVLVNCTLVGNAAWQGGGAYISALNQCLVVSNSASWSGGGVCGYTLNNCTIIGNSAASLGGGVSCGQPNNCIVYFNTAPDGANFFYVNLNYCCTTPMPTNGVGNVTNAPLFVDYAGGNLRLQSNSPCINAGLNAYAPGPTDLAGLSRIASGTVDIGAHEFQGPGSLISYAWLQQYGLPTDGSADYIDSDGEGMNNWQEYLADTSPLDANDYLHITSFMRSGTYNTLWWASKSTRLYQVERRESFEAASLWETIITNPEPGWNNVGFDNLGPQYFYRIRVVRP